MLMQKLMQLGNACTNGDEKFIDNFLQDPDLPKYAIGLGEALSLAVENNHPVIAEKLLASDEVKKRAGYYNGLILRTAVSKGYTNIVREMIPLLPDEMILATDDNQMNALHLAVANNHLDIIDALLKNVRFSKKLQDRDVYGRTALEIARSIENPTIVEKLSELIYIKNLNTFNNPEYEQLLSKVHETGDLNFANNKHGGTLLHFAAVHNDVEGLKTLIERGVVFSESEQYYTPLHVAVSVGNHEAVEYLLSILSDDELLKTTGEGRNVLHIAAEFQHTSIIELLLKNPIIRDSLFEKDIYGKTALDIAVEHKNQPLIETLVQANAIFTELSPPHNPKKSLDISQGNINNILSRYLEMAGRNASEIILIKGNCFGWDFLSQVYFTQGEKGRQEFYDILETISEWGALGSPADGLALPPSLQSKYKNFEDLIEQTINDLVIFQQTSKAYYDISLGINYGDREATYALMKDPKKGREFKDLFQIPTTLYNREQLAEMLSLLALQPGISIDITTPGSQAHAISLYITPEGNFRLYDPNHRYRVPEFQSAQLLADHLIKFNYSPNQIKKYNSVPFAFGAYRIHHGNEIIPQAKQAKFLKYNSANDFNALQYAIMSNDISIIQDALTKSPRSLMHRDAHGVSPIALAIRLKNEQVIKLLIEKFHEINPNKSELSAELNFKELFSAGNKMVLTFLENGWLDPKALDSQGNNLLNSAILAKDAVMVKYLLDNYDWDINAIDVNSAVPFHYALGQIQEPDYRILDVAYKNDESQVIDMDYETQITIQPNADIFKMIINTPRFDINYNANGQYSSLMLAIHWQVDIKMLETLVSLKNLNINYQSEDGKTALMIAIHKNPNKQLINKLLARGAKLDIKDKEGNTAYDYALKNPNLAGDPVLMEKLKVYRKAPLLWDQERTPVSHTKVSKLVQKIEAATETKTQPQPHKPGGGSH